MKSSSYSSMTESCEPELTSTGDPETVLQKLYIDLCNLIVESRIPGINERGYGEGVHCPPLLGPTAHSCDLAIPECQKHQKLIHRLLRAARRNVFEIEVLMFPDCCNETKPNERILRKEYVLLERWSVYCNNSKIKSLMDVAQLLRAVRSFLYFSQISAWLSSSGGKTPSNIYYWIKSATELSAARFEKEPEVHVFPICRIYEGLHGTIEVKYRTRSQYIPLIPCSKHPPHGNSYVTLTDGSNSCQNVSVNDNMKYLQKSCDTNQQSIDNEENSLNNSSLLISSSITPVSTKTLCLEASGSKPKGILKDTNAQIYSLNFKGTTNLCQDVDRTKSIIIVPKSQISDPVIDIYSNHASHKKLSLETNDSTGYNEVFFTKLNKETTGSESVGSASTEHVMHFSEEGQNSSKASTNISSTYSNCEGSESDSVSLPTSLSKKIRRECKTCSSGFAVEIESAHCKSNMERLDASSQRYEPCRNLNLQNCSGNLSSVPHLPRQKRKQSKFKIKRNAAFQSINYSFSNQLQNVSHCAINQNESELSNLAVNKLSYLKSYSNVVAMKNLQNLQNEKSSKVLNDVFLAKSSKNSGPHSSQVSSVPKKSNTVASNANVCRKRKCFKSLTSENLCTCTFQDHTICEMNSVTNFLVKSNADTCEHDLQSSNAEESEGCLRDAFLKCDNVKSAQNLLKKRKKSKNRLHGHKSLSLRSKMLDHVASRPKKCDIFEKSILQGNYKVVQTPNIISENGLVKSPNILFETSTTAEDNSLQHPVDSSLAVSKSKVISYKRSFLVSNKEWHSASICCETKTFSFTHLPHLKYGKIPKVPPITPSNSESSLSKPCMTENSLESNDSDVNYKVSQREYSSLQNFHSNVVKRNWNKKSNFSQTLKSKMKTVSAENSLHLGQNSRKSLKLSSYLTNISSNIPRLIAETVLLSRNVSIPQNKGTDIQKYSQMLKETNIMKSNFSVITQGNTMFECKDIPVADTNSKLNAAVFSRTKSSSGNDCLAGSSLSQNCATGREEINVNSAVSTNIGDHSNHALKAKSETKLNLASSLQDDFTSEAQNPAKRILRDVKNTTDNVSHIYDFDLLPKTQSEVSLLRHSQSSGTLQVFHNNILSRKWSENFDRFPRHLLKFSKGKKLLGNFEESILKGCLQPVSRVEGFQAEIGASGSFCPDHLTLPADVYFYELGSPHQGATPYMAHVVLGDTEYYLPKKGAMQVTLFNPTDTVVKMFVLNYDLSNMPPMCHTFIRQKTYYMPVGATEKDPSSQKWLRYIIHLRFASSKSGRIFLHKDFKIVVLNKSNDDAASDHIQEPRELRSFLSVPKNPMFSNF